MRVFITGGTGTIGEAVIKELRRAGHAVMGLSRSEASDAKLRAHGGAGALCVVSDQALRAAVDEARPDHRGGDHVVGRFERQALVRRAPGERGPSLSCPGEPATHICTG